MAPLPIKSIVVMGESMPPRLHVHRLHVCGEISDVSIVKENRAKRYPAGIAITRCCRATIDFTILAALMLTRQILQNPLMLPELSP